MTVHHEEMVGKSSAKTAGRTLIGAVVIVYQDICISSSTTIYSLLHELLVCLTYCFALIWLDDRGLKLIVSNPSDWSVTAAAVRRSVD